ncbi:MAG: ATP phosphoribosyltransferase regulatory subunit [Alphaproteobacteria bacterium]|nr:ATP phosphoribosyltransferase regulatory subunit [Alphaproteobacteria bacterium]
MNQTLDQALLPAGLADSLPPDAGLEAEAIERLLASFAAQGYQRVKPPLIEFEESLLQGPGAALAPQTFRLMDPISQRMMALRADMTPQIARIAWSRLGKAPRPLRLSYAGQVLRVRGGQLRPERQFAQAGVELIGADAPEADVEVVLLAAEALAGLGVAGLSVDLTFPTLVPALARGLGLSTKVAEEARDALDRKDVARLRALGGKTAALLEALLQAAGPADAAIAALARLDLPEEAAADRARLAGLVARLHAVQPELRLTVDPGEFRGFEYQTGIGFTLFARGVRGELGRGGRYQSTNDENAVGFTLFLDSVLRALPEPGPARLLYLPAETDPATGRRLRAEAWRTVQGFAKGADVKTEAKRLGCSHAWIGGQAISLA